MNLDLSIVRLTSLGDVVVSASCFGALRGFSDVSLRLIVDNSFAKVIQRGAEVVPLALRGKSLKGKIKSLGSLKAPIIKGDRSAIIDMQGLLKSALVARILKSKIKKLGIDTSIYGYDYNSAKEGLSALFYDKSLHCPYNTNILDRNIEILYRPLCEIYGRDFDLEYYKGVVLENRDFVFRGDDFDISSTTSDKSALLVLESSDEKKTYPLEYFYKLSIMLNQIGIKIHLLQFSTTKAQKLHDSLKSASIASTVHQISLDRLHKLLDQMDLIIGVDTGVSYLAWALKRQTIILYGATDIARFSLPYSCNLSASSMVDFPPKLIFSHTREILKI